MVVLMASTPSLRDSQSAASSLAKKCAGRCDMELGEVTQHNVQQLKRLNQALFPVSYNDKFYKVYMGIPYCSLHCLSPSQNKSTDVDWAIRCSRYRRFTRLICTPHYRNLVFPLRT